MLMGVTGAGKTTVMEALAERIPVATGEGDEFHPAANVAKMAAGIPLGDADRAPWLDSIAQWIGAQEAAGRDAIVSCSALKRSYRDRLRDGHPSIWFAHLLAPRQELVVRMRTRRGHFMPVSLLDSQLATLEELGPDEPGGAFVTDATPAAVADAILGRLRRDGRL